MMKNRCSNGWSQLYYYYYYYAVSLTCKASPGEATLMHGRGMTVYLYAAVNSSVFNFDLKTPSEAALLVSKVKLFQILGAA